MKNVIIPMDFSSSSTRVIVYTLELMREDEYNFFILNLPEAAYPEFPKYQNKEWIDCIHYEAKQRLQKLRKDIAQSFPDKKVKIQFLSSINTFGQQLDTVSLINASTEVMRNNKEQLLYKLFRTTGSPLIFLPGNKKFCQPKKILITLEPYMEIREVTLAPYKNLFGNHDLIVEIQKLYSGEMSPVQMAKDEFELKQKFEIYHPKIFKLHTGQIGEQLRRTMQQENFDLHIIPLSQATFTSRIVSSQIKKGIANSKIPVMILQGTQKVQPNFSRPRSNKIKTAIVP